MRYLLLLIALLLLVAGHARAQTTNSPASTPPGGAGAPAPSTSATATNATSTQTQQALDEANRMIGEKNYDGALAKLNGLIQADPKDVAAYLLRGRLYSEQKMYDQEANDFQAAHLLDPGNAAVTFDMAEVKFTQKSYDAARIGFVGLASDRSSFIGDLSAYKVFLCDLMGNHMDEAQKEFDAFNKVGSGASYYYANVAWSLFHHNTEEARSWLSSAANIYSAQKNGLYARSLNDLGFLPLPPPPKQG